MPDKITKKNFDDFHDMLIGKGTEPKSQIEQIGGNSRFTKKYDRVNLSTSPM
jgi:hypothetical protein